MSMECEIEWNTLTLAEWDARFKSLPRSNILQSYDYARAICAVDRQKARWGLVRIDGAEAGLVQILEAGLLGNLIHAVILDCGPLWFEGFGSKDQITAFFDEFNRTFPKRFGRRRRIIPQTKAGLGAGYIWQEGSSYETIWIDLRCEAEELRKNLNKKWRNALSKAERNDLTIEWDVRGQHIDWILMHHMAHRAEKNYGGASGELLRAMAKSFGAQGNMVIGRILYMDRPIAGIMILKHGQAATYQIGWNGDLGRKKGAHNLLLWNAVLYLKDEGFTGFDLGGNNKEDAQDVRKFKMGLGGDLVSLSGHYY